MSSEINEKSPFVESKVPPTQIELKPAGPSVFSQVNSIRE